MNCFTHALPFLDDPYMAVGSCLPDWLGAVDRKVRVREKVAEPFCEDDDPLVASLAKGIVQHHRDDHWFHQTDAFAQLSMQLSLECRQRLGDEAGFRPGLLGHIVIELLLDAYLESKYPGKLEAYYQLVESVDPEFVQDTVNRLAKKPTDKLVWYFEVFLRERYIFDYADDKRLLYRMNRVFQRVKLEPIGNELDTWMPKVRERVYGQATALLEEYPLS